MMIFLWRTCSIRATPANANFGDVALGGFKDLPITLTNSGSGNCTYDVSALSPFANLGGYGVQSQPPHNNVIGPGQTRQVVVRLTPLALNDLLFAFLFVKWNDPNQMNAAGQATVTLVGTYFLNEKGGLTASELLRRSSELARDLPVYRLTYPSGYEHLHRAMTVLADHFAFEIPATGPAS